MKPLGGALPSFDIASSDRFGGSPGLPFLFEAYRHAGRVARARVTLAAILIATLACWLAATGTNWPAGMSSAQYETAERPALADAELSLRADLFSRLPRRVRARLRCTTLPRKEIQAKPQGLTPRAPPTTAA